MIPSENEMSFDLIRGAAWAPTAGQRIPTGVGLTSVEYSLTSSNLNGFDAVPVLEGSFNGTKWSPIPNSGVTFSAIPAATVATYAPGAASSRLVDLTPYQFVRMAVGETGATDNDTAVSARLLSFY